ncbi:polyheme membrane-associated cytochrome C [Hoeflea ulvae]|uniref:Polyheme membrane-associated cytochrome C n=1 Tax=Hoeflea ulvae TaxID=2983764 RepID=A0ABT3YLB7_9HYPH|nr:polyheme membrane-associated cytochrome C [Hoeflea ulvae]MCY0096673.1 polyheme membrane-associated cytochrome C [Hoeflea ulvae]
MSYTRTVLPLLASIFLALPAAQAQEHPSVSSIVEAWIASPHGDRTSESFVHWNTEGAVPEDCATCHSGPGLMDFLGADGTMAGKVDGPAPIGSPIDCVACHSQAATDLEQITFPSGEMITETSSSAICMVCHQGRESGDSVNAAIAGGEDDTINGDLGFLNVHYRAAAATLMGGSVRGGYQYDGKTYADRFAHVPDFNTCTTCHDPHTTKVVAIDQCVACHKGAETVAAIRITPADIDGDGDAKEGISAEISTLHEKLGEAILLYAADVSGAPVVYDSHAYPYFFNDLNGDGASSPDEAIFPNRYQSWTPRLLRAAYNYQFLAKDPGAYAHNPRYAIQLAYDSLEDLSSKAPVDMTGMVRP